MLILSRRPDESIYIYTDTGAQITVKVCRVEGSQVKAGFESPGSVKIVRDELDSEAEEVKQCLNIC